MNIACIEILLCRLHSADPSVGFWPFMEMWFFHSFMLELLGKFEHLLALFFFFFVQKKFHYYFIPNVPNRRVEVSVIYQLLNYIGIDLSPPIALTYHQREGGRWGKGS